MRKKCERKKNEKKNFYEINNDDHGFNDMI